MKCDFVGEAYNGRSIAVDGQELVNLFVKKNLPNSKSQYVLYPTPGMKRLTNFSAAQGGCRTIFVSAKDRLFIVYGSSFYELVSNFDGGPEQQTLRGTLLTGSGTVSMAEVITTTGSIIHIVDGEYGYYFKTDTNTFTRINSTEYHAGTSVCSINGYFLQNTTTAWYGGTRFIRSGQYDDAYKWGTDIDPSAIDTFFTAELSPDAVNSLYSINGEVWLIGGKTIEVWYATGTELLFQRSASGGINIGSAGKYCSTVINNQLCWLGSGVFGNGAIWLTSGFVPQKISTDAIDYIIGQMSDISDCITFSYMQEGNIFVIFNFITGNRTLCYDLTNQTWHERAAWVPKTSRFARHRAIACALWANRILVGDYASPSLYEWRLDQYTDDTTRIVRERTSAHIHEDRKRIVYHNMEIDIEHGVGTNIGSHEDDPQVMLKFSDDGGYTWSYENWASAGRIGNRFARARFNRLGQSRDRVFRARFADPVKWIIIDARMDITAAAN